MIKRIEQILSSHSSRQLQPEVLSFYSGTIALAIRELEHATRHGGKTIKIALRESNAELLDKLKRTAEAAQHLLNNGMGENKAAYENELICAQVSIGNIEATNSHYSSLKGRNSLPKQQRYFFAYALMMAWREITGTQRAPRASRGERDSKAAQGFKEMIREILAAAGGHVGTISLKELHRDILAVEADTARGEQRQRETAKAQAELEALEQDCLDFD